MNNNKMIDKLNILQTPCYIINEEKLRKNLEILHGVEARTGCHILLAQKCFSCFYEYPLIGSYISGTTASGIFEARLGKEHMGKENHVFAPAFKDVDMEELVTICDHIVFNSISQLKRHRSKCVKAGVSIGLRVNPECSTQEDHAIYDPCTPGSRFGVTKAQLEQALMEEPDLLEGVDGLHFHTLCEQGAEDLEITLDAFLQKFGAYLEDCRWVNLGGGHHITKANYNIPLLEACIRHLNKEYEVEVYLEPGEAVALDAGYLLTEVLDIVENGGIKTLILDASAACHMPDVIEMPYRPPLQNSLEAGQTPYTYRLSSYTCLAGDIIGDYSFEEEKKIGDKLLFEDMAIYSMVKNNTFNGIPLPSIYAWKEDGRSELIKAFAYEDFKGRLS